MDMLYYSAALSFIIDAGFVFWLFAEVKKIKNQRSLKISI
jgi:hypothetical protein